jgi:hypothetical protein
VETDAVRIALIEEGMDVRALAIASDLKPCSLSSALSKGFPNALTRFKVEAGFQYRRPIWSDGETLEQRRRCLEKFSFDPYLVGVRGLRWFAKGIGADFSLCTDKAAMIREIFARAAIPNTTTKTR